MEYQKSRPRPINRYAILSLILAMLTFLSFCLGVIPIPFTAWVCYPTAGLFGVLALLSGFIALRQLPQRAERGRRLALLGLTAGTLTLLAVVCFTSLTVLITVYGAEALRAIWSR
jgi:hypothetical protein